MITCVAKEYRWGTFYYIPFCTFYFNHVNVLPVLEKGGGREGEGGRGGGEGEEGGEENHLLV